MLSHNFNSKRQILTSFPDQNEKHIDFVIVYKQLDGRPTDQECIKKRAEFFKELQKESFDIYDIDPKSTYDKFGYILLHCSTERLLREAESIRLKMPLKEIESSESCATNLKKKKKILNNKKKKEVLWSQYDPSVKFLFENIDNPEGPFNTCTRIFLVDNILKNLAFSVESDKAKSSLRYSIDKLINSQGLTENVYALNNVYDETTSIDIDYNKGLPAMINKGYFHDAFPLHDQTKKLPKGFCTKEVYNVLKLYSPEDAEHDRIENLNKKWARLTRMFCFQPLGEIREYFGELNAFYFSWSGTLTLCLIIPAIIGLIFSGMGLVMSFQGTHSVLKVGQTQIRTNHTLHHLMKSFDNDLSPIFAIIVCVWGAVFLEVWKRQNSKLAFEWHVRNYESYEPDLPDFVQRKEREKKSSRRDGEAGNFFYRHSKIFRYFISFLVVFFMVCVIALQIFLVALLRLYIVKKAFPNNELVHMLLGDLGTSLLESLITLIISMLFTRILVSLTHWENHRTRSKYEGALIWKLFPFEFANNYGSLFYLAYVRQVEYSNGLFNLGIEYQDKCEGNDCMVLLSIQIFFLMLIKPFIRFLRVVVKPFLVKHCCSKKNSVGILPSPVDNKTAVGLYISMEKNRLKVFDSMAEIYTDKVIFLGYILLFSCSMFAAPFMLFVVYLLELRFDAKLILFKFKRPVGYKAQDIGTWHNICQLMNILGIINNGFLIAFTSDWSKTFLKDSIERKFIFIVIFEHAAFFIWFFISLIVPDTSHTIQNKIRYEYHHVREIVSTAKYLKYNLQRGHTQLATASLSGVSGTSVADHPIEKYSNTAELKDNKLRLPSIHQNGQSMDNSLASSNESLPKLEYVAADSTARDSN